MLLLQGWKKLGISIQTDALSWGCPVVTFWKSCWKISEKGMYIPAHIWTPHFSLFGAKSGFDTIEECFEELTPYIHALETGLSSDPVMNWQISALDGYQLVSHSDAHSPSKLGREADLLDMELSYRGPVECSSEEEQDLKERLSFFRKRESIIMTAIRKCGVCLSPREAEKYNGICPVCGKKLTMGVDHRISAAFRQG